MKNLPALLVAVPILTSTAILPLEGIAQEEATQLEQMVVVGSRRVGRSALEAAVPLDVIGAEEMETQGSSDMIDVLTNVVPSYNANREPISDAGTLIRPANLRGMPSDSTLVLVNGKRRHRGAVIGEFISGLNKGAQGVDIAPLPGIAMKQVEVLRDGAAAQYGSDAIAGVLNFVLSDDPEARRLQFRTGEYFEGDGAITEISGLFGTYLGSSGFATLAFEVKDTNPTSRGIQDPSAQALADAGNTNIENPVVIWGTPEITDDYKLFFNSAVDVGSDAQAYAFGNFATRETDGSFFYRNPQTRSGVFNNGNDELLVADLSPGDADACPSVSLTGVQNVLTDPTYLSGVANNPNCFAFNEMFPGGFTPRFGGKVTDSSLVGGVRGEWSIGLDYDFSVSTGTSAIDYRIYNTVNASYGPDTPTDFDLGSQTQTEYLVNADFTMPVEVERFASDLNVAFGLQYHREQFDIDAGQEESFAPGGYEDQGFSIGSNGFQGFSTDVAGSFDRDSVGAWLDLEADITDSLLLSGAVRFEDFSDFGSTFDGKIAARLDVSDHVSFRSAVSTGFKAPTIGQNNLRRSATSFANGQLIETLVIPPTNPVAAFYGGEQLQPEESTNLSFGAVVNTSLVDLTIDYFNINVDGRIALTDISIDDADRASLVAQGSPEAQTIGQIQFFVNDFDTETQGIDIVATVPFEWENSSSSLALAYNWTDTEITNRGNTVSVERARELEDFLPNQRATLTFTHSMDPYSFMLRTNYYGETYEALFTDNTIPVVTDPLFLVDAELSRDLGDIFTVSIGAKNLFDEYPDEHEYGALPGYLGAIYPLNSPAGFNGGFYYLRVNANF